MPLHTFLPASNLRQRCWQAPWGRGAPGTWPCSTSRASLPVLVAFLWFRRTPCEWCCTEARTIWIAICSWRQNERILRSRRTRAAPACSPCYGMSTTGLSTETGLTKKKRNLVEPVCGGCAGCAGCGCGCGGCGGGGSDCELRRCLCRYQLKSRSYSTGALDDQQLLAIEGSKKSRGKAGTRRPSGRSAKKARKTSEKPLLHRHRHKVRNCPIFSTTCSCGISAVSATICDCGACTTNTTGTSTTFQKYCNCEISMVWAINLHNLQHCLDHRHLSLTTAGMSTTCHACHVATVESRLCSPRPATGTGESRQILTTCTCGTCTTCIPKTSATLSESCNCVISMVFRTAWTMGISTAPRQG